MFAGFVLTPLFNKENMFLCYFSVQGQHMTWQPMLVTYIVKTVVCYAPNEQHTIGVISHRPLKVCLAHLIWCARS